MSDSFQNKIDADLVAGAAYHDAPTLSVIGLPDSVEMMRRVKNLLQRLHVATVWLTGTLIVLTVVLVVLAIGHVYLAIHG